MSCSYFTFSAGECGAGNSAFRCMAMKHVEHWAKTWFVINKVGDKTFQRGNQLRLFQSELRNDFLETSGFKVDHIHLCDFRRWLGGLAMPRPSRCTANVQPQFDKPAVSSFVMSVWVNSIY